VRGSCIVGEEAHPGLLTFGYGTVNPWMAEADKPAYALLVSIGRGPLPTYVQLFDFLPKSERRRLFDWALANSKAFAAATVTSGKGGDEGAPNPQQRIALTTRKLEGIEGELTPHLTGALDRIMELTGYSGATPSSLELELAAHGDGAHYIPHLDIPLGKDRVPLGAWNGEDRALSAVYYFHSEPKRFSGGELRLFRFGTTWDCSDADPASYVDLEPIDNSLVVFPSWAMHEVRPVRCPSGEFRDYRFALNCWYCRPTA